MSQLPFFYSAELTAASKSLQLDETNSRHVVQVLRMQAGEQVKLTNGKGLTATAAISDAHKKHATVSILTSEMANPPEKQTAIAMSPVKNNSRYEWFLEKATELGITEIYPLLCARTERAVFKHDRFNAICISAMLQSQQAFLPILHQPVQFEDLVTTSQAGDKWIAHCLENEKTELSAALNSAQKSRLILIGPEGDFSPGEITTALDNGFVPVALGENRLRTETAGVVAATLLSLL